MAKNVGVQLYTVRDFTHTAQDLTDTLKKIRQIGYTAVEASPFGPLAPQELKDLLDSEGLAFPSTHLGLDQIENEFDRVAEALNFFGCRHVACSGREGSEDGYKRFAAEALSGRRETEKRRHRTQLPQPSLGISKV